MIHGLWEHKTLFALFALSLVLVLGGVSWAYFAMRDFQGPFVLHFDDILGITQIGGANALLAAGFTGMVVVVINLVLAFELEVRNRFLSRLVAGSTLVFAALIFMGFAAIISVN